MSFIQHRERIPEVESPLRPLEKEPVKVPWTKNRRRILQVLAGRWVWIALFAIFGLAGSLYYLSKAPPIHSATATLLVKQKSSAVLLSEKEGQESLDMRSDEALNTVAAQLKRRSLLEKVVSREDIQSLPGLVPEPVEWTPEWAKLWLGGSAPAVAPSKKLSVIELASNIDGRMSVTVRRKTRLLDLKFLHPDKEIARKLADAVVEEYLSESTTSRSDGRQSSIALLKVESERARGDLQSAQKASGSYQQALKMQAELEKKEDEISVLSKRYRSQHPKMISAQAGYDELQGSLLAEIERLRTSGSDLEFWRGVSGELKDWERKSDVERLVDARRLLLSRTAVLESEIRSQESVFNAMLTKLQETDVNEAASKVAPESECEISSPALISEWPESPKKPIVLAAGLAGGSVVGVLLAFLLSAMDNKLRSVSQLETLTGLPVFAAVAALDLKKAEKEKSKKLPLSPALGSNEHEQSWDKRLVFRQGLEQSQYAEMYRVLRASITLLGDEAVRKVTMFTSAIPGEGKTLTSVNLAMAAAAQGKSVLLIDLDLRKPAVHKLFGIRQDQTGFGSTQVLAGQCSLKDAVYRGAGVKNLDIILSGTRAPRPGELLVTHRLMALLAEARSRYDVVVIDSAPLLAVPDTRVIAPLVDACCMVVRAESTPQGAVLAALELLASNESLPDGLVFNAYSVKRRLPGYHYYSYYGQGPYSSYGATYQYGYGNYGD